MRYFRLLLTFTMLMTSSRTLAQCTAPEYQQFDFWLGSWQVTSGASSQISENNISKINKGCGLLEEYHTPSGYYGKSLNIYDKQSKQWHQTWIDSSGLLLQLSGQFDGKSMIMTGAGKNVKGEAIINKITWTPQVNGSVRQLWQISSDDGENWQTVFDGNYQKISEKKAGD